MGFLLWLSQFLFLALFHLHFEAIYCLSSISSSHLCNHDQSVALLQFKQSFTVNSSASDSAQKYPKTESWKEGTDCCFWDGVTCDRKTGHVIGLDLAYSMLYGTVKPNSTLFYLHHLQQLDLSGNDFNSWHVPFQFGHFFNLTHLNLSYSAFVGEVPKEISHLSRLVSLDLSSNSDLTIEPISFQKLVQNLNQLRQLHLDDVNMSLVAANSLMNLSSSLSSLHLRNCELRGKFPDNILHRSNLQSLALGGNKNIRVSFPCSNVSSALSYLDLSETKISMCLENSVAGKLKSMKFLSLRNCNITRSNLAWLDDLTQLEYLDLSFNRFNGQIPPSFANLTHLAVLDFSNNNLSGQIPQLFANITHLTCLYLSNNNLNDQIPQLLANLTQLTLLDLSNNYLNGQIPQSLASLTQLTRLYLRNNNLSGQIPQLFANLTQLTRLTLSNNNLSGQIPQSLASLTQLTGLALSNNNLSGQIPQSLASLTQLIWLALSNNNLCGQIPRSLANLTQLTELDLSNNNLYGQIPQSLASLTQLIVLNLSNNNLSGQIPQSLTSLTQLIMLDLSNNNLSDQIPQSLASLTQLIYINLSTNRLIGHIPSQFSLLSNLTYVILSSNLLNGTLPPFLFALPFLTVLRLDDNLFTGHISPFKYKTLELIDLSLNNLDGPLPSSVFEQETLQFLRLASNNKLSGEIPSSVCKLEFLGLLDLSNNSVAGFMPQCLGNFSKSLTVLNVGANNLQGTIPATFSEGNSLKYLNFNNNELEGGIPTSIVNCKHLELLDLGNNKIEDTFPYFLEMLPQLQVLVLRSNKLHGFLQRPISNLSFSMLRIFDLSNNNLNGPLPTEYFNNLKAMMKVSEHMTYMGGEDYGTYYYSTDVTWKGVEVHWVKIQTLLATINLSGNKFTGGIPWSIVKLKSLQQLNLSHNCLTGHIQPSLGELANLESLDLSSNSLTGRIPVQLGDLTFLEVLNLSFNQLEGPIPSGKQFNTFDHGSYDGNLGLCGFQISKSCYDGDGQKQPPSNFGEEGDTIFEEGFGWKAVAMGYVCGVPFGLLIGYVVFRTRNSVWFVRVVEGDRRHKNPKSIKKTARRNDRRRG